MTAGTCATGAGAAAHERRGAPREEVHEGALDGHINQQREALAREALVAVGWRACA
jgi:hypothetical protein